MEYGHGCGSSNSDFWKDSGRDDQFGACCISTIGRLYKFKNGLELAISKTTMEHMISAKEIDGTLRSSTHKLARFTMLGNFSRVVESKTISRHHERIHHRCTTESQLAYELCYFAYS